MQTIDKQQLTPEQRQANVDRFLARWKSEKDRALAEAKERFKTPEYQAMLKELRQRNAKKGIIIPEL